MNYERCLGISPFPGNIGYTVSPGEYSDLVLIIQIMLNSLRMYHDHPHLPLSGRYGDDTTHAVKSFQQTNGIPCTGAVDAVTWNRMAQEYDLTVRQ